MDFTITVPDPRGQVGDTFIYRIGKTKIVHDATITGYHVELDTDTGHATLIYRGVYLLMGQPVSITVPRSIVDRQLLTSAG